MAKAGMQESSTGFFLSFLGFPLPRPLPIRVSSVFHPWLDLGTAAIVKTSPVKVS
jgi:hypothetical protein